MLTSTFQHLKGIGDKIEEQMWRRGILSWEQYVSSITRQRTLFDKPQLEAESILSESFRAYENGDMAFFAKRLNNAEFYRIALEFPSEVLFLDIETTGLSIYYDQITIVGWSVDNRYSVYIQGEDDTEFRSALANAKVIVTFNGTLFDLKFIDKYFKNIVIPPVHIDLRYFAKRVELTGGQKKIEKEIGFTRESEIEGMLGEAAPILWHKYRRGEMDAMRRLIEYNHADIEGMKWILDACVTRYFKRKNIPSAVQKNPDFAKRASTIEWTEDKEKATSCRIWIPPFSGTVKPLITYDDLNDIYCLDNFCAIGIDLVSSDDRESGFCVLKGNFASTCRVKSDDEMIRLAIEARADIVSIDSPLSIPRGRTDFFDDDPFRNEFGITRECERILKRRGISSYPCLINSMQKLTRRGMLLAAKFRKLGIPVIESYPGAAQDIMAIPRKQAGLDYLVEGLREFGIKGEFAAEEVSHDELDAITSAIVAHFFWVGMYEGLGNEDEEYLIIPDLNVDYNSWLSKRIIGLSGGGSFESVVTEYLIRQGYYYVSHDDIMKKMRKEMDTENLSDHQKAHFNVVDMGNRLIGKKLIEIIKDHRCVVIDGLRWRENHALMIETYGPAFIHLYITNVKEPYTGHREAGQQNNEAVSEKFCSYSENKQENPFLELAHHCLNGQVDEKELIKQVNTIIQ